MIDRPQSDAPPRLARRRKARRSLVPFTLPPDFRRRCDEVTDEDVTAAFGLPVADAVIDRFHETQALFTLEGHARPSIYVFVRDHQDRHADGRVRADGWWPADDIDTALDGIGDEGYVTRSGGVVARLGSRWTAGVRTDPVGDWRPGLEQSQHLLARVVDRLRTWPEPITAGRWWRKSDSVEDRAKGLAILRSSERSSRRRFMAGPGALHRAERLGHVIATGAIFLIAVVLAVLAVGLYHEAGAAGLFGRRAEAEVTGDCHGFRQRRCEAMVWARDDGRLLDRDAALFSGARLESGDDIEVRYRRGHAVPDNVPERFRSVVMSAGLAVAAILALLAAGAHLTGRKDARYRLAIWGMNAVLVGTVAAFALKFASPS